MISEDNMSKNKSVDFSLVCFDKVFFEKSKYWLEDEEIRELTMSPLKVDEKLRLEWFNSLSSRKDYKIWGVRINGEPIGVCGLKSITNNTAYVFWYIGEKDYWGKGIGNLISASIIQSAIKLKITNLYAVVTYKNYKSVNLLFKSGYTIINKEVDGYLFEKILTVTDLGEQAD